jgi:hypothetical protein
MVMMMMMLKQFWVWFAASIIYCHFLSLFSFYLRNYQYQIMQHELAHGSTECTTVIDSIRNNRVHAGNSAESIRELEKWVNFKSKETDMCASVINIADAHDSDKVTCLVAGIYWT